MDFLQNLKNDFIKLTESGKLFHSYLFFGESTDEIFEFCRKFANYLETGAFETPKKILNDFHSVSPNEFNNIGIDEIRELQNFLYQTPNVSKRRTAIVRGAGALTADSQGALLKLMEEPPKKSLIILISRQEDELFKTILSRTHKVYFLAPFPLKTELENDELTKENLEKLLANSIIDLRKNLVQNVDAAKEIVSRLALIKQYNLNNRLQLRLLERFIKTKKTLKKPNYGKKRA